LVLVGLLVLGALFVPPLRPILLVTTNWLAVALVVAGIGRHRPPQRTAWALLTTFVALVAIGNVSRLLSQTTGGMQMLSDVATVGAQLAAAAALPPLLRAARDTAAPWEWQVVSRGRWLDVAVLTVVVTLVATEMFVRGVRHHQVEAMPWAIALAPGVDALLVGVLLWVLFSRARLLPAMVLILVGGFGCLIYDLLATLAGERVTSPGQSLQALGVANMLMFGLAALHPSMAALGDPRAPRHARQPSTQLLLLLPCALLPPVLLGAHLLTDAVRAPTAVLLIATVFVFLALAVRAVLALRHSEISAERDPLTGLLNRRGLARAYARMDNVTHVRASASSPVHSSPESSAPAMPTTRPSSPTSHTMASHNTFFAAASQAMAWVLLIDLDDFKHVNDRYGHPSGDALLRATARRLREAVGECGVVARHGGDEFIVLLPCHTASAPEVLTRITAMLSEPVQAAGHALSLTASTGVASAQPGDTLDDVLADADIAMYAAKTAGKSTSSLFHPRLRNDVVNTITLTEDLHLLLDGALLERAPLPDSSTDPGTNSVGTTGVGQLTVVYQPVVDLADGRVVGAEALVRWQHPQRGSIPPDDFLSLAEHEGLGAVIDEVVLHQALAQLRRWDHAGVLGLSMSVNLGLSSTCDPHLPQLVRRALDAYGLAPHRLHLEITEHDALPDDDSVRAALHEVVATGVVLVLDDFGIGYTSLHYLHRYPISVLKLDRSLITHGDDPAPFTLPAGIAALAATLGLTTIAEGIEHASQSRDLRELGIGYGQGYHYSPPLSPDAFAAFHASSSKRSVATAPVAPGPLVSHQHD